MDKNKDFKLSDFIFGLGPFIYAFKTKLVPDSLKVGDTQRSVRTRIDEWRKEFNDAEEVFRDVARISDNKKSDYVIFRDLSVHKFLDSKHERINPEELKKKKLYPSKEFFKNISNDDVSDAIADIRNAYENNVNRGYVFYKKNLDNIGNLSEIPYIYNRDSDFKLRNNQKDVVNRFMKRYNDCKKNNRPCRLLMYAVMRFGKSFTAMHCAVKMSAKLIVVVSAKKDVRTEWKETVERQKAFKGFRFLEKSTLEKDYINKILSPEGLAENGEIYKKAVVFLILQDLMGPEIKNHQKELFLNKIDLLIVDETHFAARASEYGKVLKNQLSNQMFGPNHVKLGKKEKIVYDSELEEHEISSEDFSKILKAKVRLDLSGTPYKILMKGEYQKEDIICSCQFHDILAAQRKWEFDDREQSPEWENPYYGFPEMIRFAFAPSQASKKILKNALESGYETSLSELFKPHFTNGATFVHEKEVLDLISTIDGTTKSSEVLGFLDCSEIKNGNMCRHMVWVLPYRASCDAMVDLINKHRENLKNIKKYKILNIAGTTSNIKGIEDVKKQLTEAENNNQKTISLTVIRMLTGSTIPQWDSMLYFKDTESPQEYDQAIFRLQSPYVLSRKDGNNEMKINMKPQTLLVDFDILRMYKMQEARSTYYDLNKNVSNERSASLRKAIEEDLEISPIITMDHGKLSRVECRDILREILDYKKNKSIMDEAKDIDYTNFSVFENEQFKKTLAGIDPIDSKNGLLAGETYGDGNGINNTGKSQKKDDTKFNVKENSKAQEIAMKKLLMAYCARILFYAFLSKTDCDSLLDIIDSLSKNDSNKEENKRLANILKLKKDDLEIFLQKGGVETILQLNKKISCVREHEKDENLKPLEKAEIATRNFSRISESEVVLSSEAADRMVDMLPANIKEEETFLDIASRRGEVVCALYKKFSNRLQGKKFPKIYSIPTSPIAREITCKIYEMLGLNKNWVLDFFTGDILDKKKKQSIFKKLNELKIDTVISAPPFKISDGGGDGTSGSALYHIYFETMRDLGFNRILMFMKAVWYSGGKGEGLTKFREDFINDQRVSIFHDFPDPDSLKINAVLRGGVCMFLWDKEHTGKCKFYNHINGETTQICRHIKTSDYDILLRYNSGLPILTKVMKSLAKNSIVTYDHYVSERDPFKFGDAFKDFSETKTKRKLIKLYRVKKKIGYVSESQLKKNEIDTELYEKFKVLVAKTSPGEDHLPHAVISTPILARPHEICTNGLLVVRTVNTKLEAENLIAYCNTIFFRFMMMMAKNAHNLTSKTYRFLVVHFFKQKNLIS